MSYTLLITDVDGDEGAAVTDYPSDEATIADVRYLLSAERPRITVARGFGDGAVVLGTWDWCGGQPCWTRAVREEGEAPRAGLAGAP